MNVVFEEYRRQSTSIPVFVAYLRLLIGGCLFMPENIDFADQAIGQVLGTHLPAGYDLIFDETADILIHKSERLSKLYNPVTADGIQDNLALKKVNRSKKSGKSITLNNADQELSRLWAREPFLGREIYVKMGFLGMPYYYFNEIERGVITAVKYSSGKVVLTVES